MEGKIDKKGALSIIRGGVLKEQWCPFDGTDPTRCADHCPHFGEPKHIKKDYKNEYLQDAEWTEIQLCHGTKLFFDKLTDERDKKPA